MVYRMPALRLVMVVCVQLYSVFANEYCAVPTCPIGEHTMCKYDPEDPACDDYEDASLTVNEQKHILAIHNKWRNKVANGNEPRGNPGPQPQASNMRQISWNGELKAIAQRWSQQCQAINDKCRDTVKFRVGQNIGGSPNLKENLENLVGVWYEEVAQASSTVVDNLQASAIETIGHYAQTVLAPTHLLGCAKAIFTERAMNSKWVRLFCNYGPGGGKTMVDKPLYSKGKPATNCTEGTFPSKTYLGLCATPEQLRGEDGSGKDPQTQVTWVLLGSLSILLTVL